MDPLPLAGNDYTLLQIRLQNEHYDHNLTVGSANVFDDPCGIKPHAFIARLPGIQIEYIKFYNEATNHSSVHMFYFLAIELNAQVSIILPLFSMD